MTGEPASTQQQRAAVELYVRSKWIKASLALEDENLFIEYAQPKRDQTTPTNINDESPPPAIASVAANGSTSNNETADTITSQKRTVKIVKPDNTGLGQLDERKGFRLDLSLFQASASKVDEKIACRY